MSTPKRGRAKIRFRQPYPTFPTRQSRSLISIFSALGAERFQRRFVERVRSGGDTTEAIA